MSRFVRPCLCWSLFLLVFSIVTAAEAEDEDINQGLNSLPEVQLRSLSQQDWNPLSARALSIQPQNWRHGETDHFIYHFFHSYVATPISVEAEFNYRVIVRELGLETLPGAGGKSHIYVFERPDAWKTFQNYAHLEPWTGGIHASGSLFLLRNPSYKFADNSLGHEIAHLVLFRIYQRPLPRWLDEGFAEYISRLSHASYHRARNFIARAHSNPMAPDKLIPLSQLTTMLDYPPNDGVAAFYQESERLVRFLAAADPMAFRALLDSVARGDTFDTALAHHYSGRFFDVAALEKEFVPYACNDVAIVPGLP